MQLRTLIGLGFILIGATFCSLAEAQTTGELVSRQGAVPKFNIKGLVISEVSPGPYLSYVELYNGLATSIDLDGHTIETSTGIFDLSGLLGPLDPGDYFLLLTGSTAEVGISNDLTAPGIIVATPTCGHVGDTVLLKDSVGDIVDAVSYGIVLDTSARYTEAVADGQFTAGEFIDVSSEFQELAIGRDANNTDTNDLADWSTSGGANTYVGSPWGQNVELPGGENGWIVLFQATLANVISQDQFGITVETGSYANYVETAGSSTCDHTMVFSGDAFGAGSWTLTGSVSNVFTPVSTAQYKMQSYGTLSDAFGNAVYFDVTRTLGGAQDGLAVEMLLTTSSGQWPYLLEMDRTFMGVRGAFLHDLTRELTGWSGTMKTTTGSQSVDWALGTDGTIASVTSSASYSRPYPLDDGRIGNAVADPIVATETGYLDFFIATGASSPVLTMTKLEHHYDNDIPSIIGSGFSILVQTDTPVAGAVQTQMAGTYLASGQTFPMDYTATYVPSPDEKLLTVTQSGQVEGVPVYGFTVTYDPPVPGVFGFWAKAKAAVRGTAKAIGTVAMCAVAGVGCAATSLGGAAVGGGVTMATLGAATPLAVGSATAGITTCMAMGLGAGYVVGKIWEK